MGGQAVDQALVVQPVEIVDVQITIPAQNIRFLGFQLVRQQLDFVGASVDQCRDVRARRVQ